MREVVKATKDIMGDRVRSIVHVMLEGGENDLVQWVQDEFELGRTSAFDYLNKARMALAENINLPLEFGRGMERLRMYQTCLAREGEFAAAGKIQTDINKMLGLNAPDKLLVKDVSQDGNQALADAIDKVTQADRPEVIEASFRVLMEGEEESDGED